MYRPKPPPLAKCTSWLHSVVAIHQRCRPRGEPTSPVNPHKKASRRFDCRVPKTRACSVGHSAALHRHSETPCLLTESKLINSSSCSKNALLTAVCSEQRSSTVDRQGLPSHPIGCFIHKERDRMRDVLGLT